MHLCLCLDLPGHSLFFFSECYFHSGHTGIKPNQSEPGIALQKSHGICFELVTIHFQSFSTNFCFSLHIFSCLRNGASMWRFLEREDQEFKRAMQEEVSITSVPFYFSLNLIVNNRILAGAGIIAQCEEELSNIQEMFSSFMLWLLQNFTSA